MNDEERAKQPRSQEDNMKRRTLSYCFAIMLLIGCAGVVCAQPQGPDILWTHSYDTLQFSSCSQLLSLTNGDIIAFGDAFVNTDYDLFVARIDSNGALKSIKTYGMPYYGEFSAGIIQNNDGGFVIGGFYTHDIHADVCLFKIDSTGNTVWSRYANDNDSNQVYRTVLSITKGFDEEILIAGSGSCLENPGNQTCHWWEYGPNGSLIWAHCLPEPIESGRLNSCIATLNGGYAYAGSVYFIETNSNGELQLLRQLLPPLPVSNIDAKDLIQGDDGGFMITGNISTNAWHAFLIRINEEGDTLWTRIFSDNLDDFGLRVIKTRDGRFTVFGISYRDQGDTYALRRMTAEGDLLWQEYYPANTSMTNIAGFAIDQNGRYIMSGVSDYGLLIIKTQSDSTLSIQTENSVLCPINFALSAFPNPFNSTTTLKFSLPSFANVVELTVYDVLGREVLRKELHPAALSFEYRLDASAWGSGVYFVSAAAKGQRAMEKVLLLK
jgi:hypothetical protein